jgi:acyl-CoA reductase-like NAD-dependent aldehyde dehydrogenase
VCTPTPFDRGVRDRAGGLHRRCRPPGVFTGPVVGDETARNPGTDGIAFIGSTATGRLVGQAAAGKAALLEMGGNGPPAVMDDAAAVEATLTAYYLCAGQSCTAGERILLHRAVQDEYVEKLARRVTEGILPGDHFDEATTIGSLNNEPLAKKMDQLVPFFFGADTGGAVVVTRILFIGAFVFAMRRVLPDGAQASGFPAGDRSPSSARGPRSCRSLRS